MIENPLVIPNGDRSIQALPRVGPNIATKFTRLGIKTVTDLIWHLPRSWIDLTQPQPIKSIRRDTFAVLDATIKDIQIDQTRRSRMVILQALLEDETQNQISAIWFNQPFLAPRLKIGRKWRFWGQVVYDFNRGMLQLQNPKFGIVNAILPVYPETEGITSAFLRTLIKPLLSSINYPDYLKYEVRISEKLLTQMDALKLLHAPKTIQDTKRARERLALDELIKLISILNQRRKHRLISCAPIISTPVESIKKLVDSLPFKLTNAQRKASWQILQNINQSVPMSRMLLGDVGSGKTIVAVIAAYSALLSGQKVIWLAPTQILAEQHVESVKKILAQTKFLPELVTATTKPKNLSKSKFLIGTHAILNLKNSLKNLGLVIIDEQHRFGVEQRDQLTKLESKKNRPHLLLMTATPIPRSLALTIFGDLECSFLDEMPIGRKPVATRLISPLDRDKAYELAAQEITAGRQVFVVCPHIEESVDNHLDFEAETKSVKKRFDMINKDSRFAKFKLGLLHGKLKAQEKQTVMQDFAVNKIQLLVATSLIEVGIDVPNATVLIIESADRFGLAQLHQLRGRVGRGAKQSLCVCIAEDWSEISQKRLNAFKSSNNGFELAELDLKLRGPGDLIGDLQAGLPPLKLANLADTQMIARARRIIEKFGDSPIR